MVFLRPATQCLIRRPAVSGSTATIAQRSSGAYLSSILSSRTPSTTRGFADANASPASSPWANFQMAPPDPIIGLTEVWLFVYDDML